MDYLTKKQKENVNFQIRNHAATMAKDIAEKGGSGSFIITINEPKVKNARYIVHNPQQLNALYARLNGGIGIDGQKALQYQSRIVTAIKDNNKYVKSIAGIIGASVPVTQRELAQMEQMGIVKVNGHGAYARIELVK